MALWGSLQVKFGLSYIAVIAAVLLLLNTYPLLVSEDLVFRSKETNMTGSVSVVVYSLAGLNRIESWIEAIFAYVSSEAINHGVSWDGYKVVEGRSKRQFLDTKSVVAAAEKAGYTDIYKTELISLTAFEKLMGKKKFQEILGEYVVKPPGKLALVPDSDPREAVDLQTAEDEFAVLD